MVYGFESCACWNRCPKRMAPSLTVFKTWLKNRHKQEVLELSIACALSRGWVGDTLMSSPTQTTLWLHKVNREQKVFDPPILFQKIMDLEEGFCFTLHLEVPCRGQPSTCFVFSSLLVLVLSRWRTRLGIPVLQGVRVCAGVSVWVSQNSWISLPLELCGNSWHPKETIFV